MNFGHYLLAIVASTTNDIGNTAIPNTCIIAYARIARLNLVLFIPTKSGAQKSAKFLGQDKAVGKNGMQEIEISILKTIVPTIKRTNKKS